VKRLALVLVALFILALAVMIASRLSETLMTVIVGVVIGVGCSIPCVILLLYVMERDRRPAQQPPQVQPPVIVYDYSRHLYVNGASQRQRFGQPNTQRDIARWDGD
jgi:positive regulator of sigma E activity